jgi:hypothetical protein
VLTALLGLGAALGAVVGPLTAAAPAAAAPPAAGPPAAVPPAAAPDDDHTEDPDRPLRIDVGRFEPRSITPGSAITVTGTLTNTGSSTVTDLGIRLQRGGPVTTRAELSAAVPDPATAAVAPFQDVAGELEPGDSLDFTYTVRSEELGFPGDGVYPALLNVNGSVDGDPRRVGELSTYVVQEPMVPAARTAVAWLWPLTEPSHRDARGRFVDDDLAEAVAADGRLDRLLALVERIPQTVAAEGTAPVPGLPVTLAVDPALIEELEIMAAGPYAVDGEAAAGRGTDDAASFLDRLRTVAIHHPVVALPYGDVDGDALTSAGLTDVLTRSLPGTPRGTAQDPLGSAAPPATPSGTAPATDPAGPEDPPSTGAGARILADVLGIEPRTDLAWAPGGSLRPDTLAALQVGGTERLVVDAAGISHGAAVVGQDGGRAAARTTVAGAEGPAEVLVADPVLAQVVAAADSMPGGPRMAEQRYLAELAVLAQQAPPGTEQTVLVAAPRGLDPGLDGVGAMMSDTAGLPWLRPASLDDLAAGPASPPGALVDPADAALLDPTGLARVVESVASRDDLAGAVVDDADTALQEYDAAIARATSTAWRNDPEGFRAAADDLAGEIARLRGRVTLLAPADGTYTLASTDAPLVLTVRNDLPFAVQVLLDVRARGTRGLTIGDIGPQVLAPDQRTTLQVPTELRQSGGFAVTATVTTPAGGPLGDPVEMQVKSTVYGPISLIITIGAATLLALLFLRRLIRFLMRRRRARLGGTPVEGAPEGAAVSQPPTRSPV